MKYLWEEPTLHTDIDHTEVGSYYILCLDDFDTDEGAFEHTLSRYEDAGLHEELLKEIVDDLAL